MMTTALALAASGSATAATGWYVGLAGGASFVEDSDYRAVPGATYTYGLPVRESWELDTGWIVTGTVGYKWASNWRVEFELGYRSNDGDLIDFAVGDVGETELTEFTQFLNVLYDIPLSSRVNLTLGAGIGGDLVEYDDNFPLNNFDDDYVLAGQLIAQLGYEVTKQLELYVDYRYLVADEAEFVDTNGPSAFSAEIDKHAVQIGLRYDLVRDEEPVVIVAPPPPPPPEAPRQFILFFGFNKWNLTSDAQRVVGEAASTAKQVGAASILVTGHTDTVGSSRYNDRLSMRRATSVKEELMRNGIAPEQISAIGKGESELLIKTGDGVKEPQNRRATIDLP